MVGRILFGIAYCDGRLHGVIWVSLATRLTHRLCHIWEDNYLTRLDYVHFLVDYCRPHEV